MSAPEPGFPLARAGYLPIAGSVRAARPGEEPAGQPDPAEGLQVSVILRHATPVRVPAAPAGPLSRDQFAARHGARDEDIASVRAFAAARGLRVAAADRARRTVVLEGSLQALSDAFATTVSLVRYQGAIFRAPAEPVQVPAELAEVVEGVFGFDTRPVAAPRNVGLRPEDERASFTPLDLATLYDFPAGLDGSGQVIAILELGGGYTTGDLTTYFAGLGLTPPSVTTQRVDGADNSPTGDPNGPDGEVMLDIEVSGAIAPGASIVVYFAPNADYGFIDALSTAIQASDQPCCVSISWGAPEANWTGSAMTSMNGYLEDAAALGIPVFVATADKGSSDGLGDGLQHADFPASGPYAVACGGTRLESADAVHIDSEVVWNDDSGATGGGVSDVFPLPYWQAGAGVPPTVNPGHFQGRGVPDVAGNASQDTGYQIRVDGTTGVAGGTSCVAPLWSGLTARMSQYLGDGGTGFLGELLYADTQARQTFRDITSGNNGSYSAGVGWDPCTGWGTPDGQALLTVLGNWNFAQWQAGD
jgi:kumamolisin